MRLLAIAGLTCVEEKGGSKSFSPASWRLGTASSVSPTPLGGAPGKQKVPFDARERMQSKTEVSRWLLDML